jgi:hypothetical protein
MFKKLANTNITFFYSFFVNVLFILIYIYFKQKMSKSKIKVDESLYPNTSELPLNEDKTNEKETKKSEDEHTLKDDLEDYVEVKEAESPINSANLKSDL